eukprot:4151121-Prymnesium_polylepis.1
MGIHKNRARQTLQAVHPCALWGKWPAPTAQARTKLCSRASPRGRHGAPSHHGLVGDDAARTLMLCSAPIDAAA